MRNKLKSLKFQIVPLLFSINCTYWTMSSLFRTPMVVTPAGVIIIHCLLFIWFEKEKNAGKKGNLEFTIGTILYMLAVFIIIAVSNELYVSDYVEWFRSTQPGSEVLIGYWLVTLMLLCYFFASTVYYFSEIIFRLPVLFLLSVVPLLLQTLNAKKEINISFVLFLILLFSLYVEKIKRKEKVGESYKKINYYGYLQAVTLFVAVTILAAVIIPKPDRLPRMKYMDEMLSYILRPVNDTAKNKLIGQNNDSNMLEFLKLRKTSKINAVQTPASDRILFEVQADEPLYFRVQSWDKYGNNQWYIGNKELENGYSLEGQSRKQMKLGVLLPMLERLKNAEALDFRNLGLDGIFKNPSVPQKKKSAYVTVKNYTMQSYLNTPGVISIKGDSKGPIYMDKLVSSFPGGRQSIGSNVRYRIDYVSQALDPASREFQYVHSMNKDKYKAVEESLLKNVTASGTGMTLSTAEQAVLRSTRMELAEASENFTSLPDNLPGRIYNLAKSLTQQKVSDYDKALAIESYFHRSDFKYDLYAEKASDDRDCNDYFIFEGKRGGCAQFASAMVILARASGLPARYVEGFVAQEKDAVTGNYIVREKNAHAFPEVYISGFGWMVFEPTSSSEAPADNLTGYLKGAFRGLGFLTGRIGVIFKNVPIYLRFICALLLSGLILIVARVFFSTRRKLWKQRVVKMGRNKGIEEIFSRIDSLLGKINLAKKNYETPFSYAERIHAALGISMVSLADVYYKSKYGGMEPSEQDISAALYKYEEIRSGVRASKGKFHRWNIFY